jgi:ketosteroid isomerase-like protein
MQRHIIAVLYLVISSTLCPPQVTPSRPSSAVKIQIEEAIRQRLDALRRGDGKQYATYFAENCFVTDDNGARIEPGEIAKEWIDATGSGVSHNGGDPQNVEVNA